MSKKCMRDDIFCEHIRSLLGLDSIDDDLCESFRRISSKAAFIAKVKELASCNQLSDDQLENAWSLLISGTREAAERLCAQPNRKKKPSGPSM